MTSTALCAAAARLAPHARFHERLQHERHQREARQQRCDSKRRLRIVFVVKNFNMKRQRIRDAADVPRHDRHRAKLPHRPRGRENHAVEQAPFDVGQRHAEEHLKPAGAKHAGRFLLLSAGGLHDRNDLARHERERNEDRREHDPRNGKHNLEAVIDQPRSKPAAAAEQEHEYQAGNHRRHGEWQIDEGHQQLAAAKLKLAHRPSGGHAEDNVERHGDGCREEGEPQRGDRIRLDDGGRVGVHALRERFDEHRRERHDQEENDETECDRGQRPSGRARGSVR